MSVFSAKRPPNQILTLAFVETFKEKRFLINVISFSAETDSNKTLVSSEYLTLEYSLDFKPLEIVIGATFHNNYLLVYSENILTILDLSQNTTQKPVYKYLSGFHPKKLGK